MKLSDLVKIYNNVGKVELENIEAVHKSLTVATVHIDEYFQEEIQKLIGIANNVQTYLDFANEVVTGLKTKIAAQIEKEAEKYCIKDNIIDDVHIGQNKEIGGYRASTLNLSDEASHHLISKVRNLTSPMYPALEIGPGDGLWTKALVAADPLYLVDIYEEFLDSAANQFPEEYQRRLRKYKVNQGKIGYTNLSNIPQNQFGFVFACNVFEYFTLDVFTEYLKSIFGVLRPGGTAIISYHNTEFENNVIFVEYGIKTWMPKTKLVEICKNIGFEIVETVDYPAYIHWIEIKKPGELKTSKITQGIAMILDKEHLGKNSS